MKYQVEDSRGNVVDQSLSYEEALMWVDGPVKENGCYVVVPMKGD